MKLLRVIPFIVLAAGASAAIAQDVPQAAQAKPPEEKKICQTVTPTGSVMSKRICLTKDEWKQLNARYAQQNSAFRDRESRSGANPAQ